MKRRRAFSFLAALCMAVCLAFAFAACGENHTHTFGDWTITVQPTPSAGGKASHVCAEDDYKEEVELPALSDTSVWQKSTTPSTHTVAGKDVYTSEYGTVEVPLPKTEGHTFGDWEITVEPTQQSGGTAAHSCACGEKETKDLPALSDDSFWTKKSTPASHTADGSDVYTSEYGEVTVTIPKQEHTYGAWEITKDPTMTAGGTAKRTCTANDGGEETKDIPALNDDSVWVKSYEKSSAATHAEEGVDVYTSDYGEVRVTLPKLEEHTYGPWTITKDPTETEQGKAKHTCTVDQHDEEIDIPNLKDTSVWQKIGGESKAATHTEAGQDVYYSVYGKVTVEIPAEGHDWGNWEIVQNPTQTEQGKARRTCKAVDGGEETKDIPALSNTEVWTKDEENSRPASHTQDGRDVYTSEYGEVTVVLPASTEHQWSAWGWKDDKAPTADSGATATRSCNLGCGEVEEHPVPNLKDADFWNVSIEKGEFPAPDKTVYSCDYGSVSVDIPRVYYGGIAIDLNTDDGIKNGKPSVTDSWPQSIALDENGVGYGSGMPFTNHSKYEFKLVDKATGRISITITAGTLVSDTDNEYEYETEKANAKTIYGYFDSESGIILMPNNDSLSYFHLISPYGAYSSRGEDIKVSVSSWGVSEMDYSAALSYTYKAGGESKTVNLFLHSGVVTFGVTFTDLKGEAITAENCYGSAVVYVKKGEEKIASVGFDGEKMAELDGYEGEYTCDELGTVKLDGFGKLTVSKDGTESTGAYAVVDENELELFVTTDAVTKYYSATVDENILHAAEVTVKVSYDMHDHGTQVEEKNVSKKVAIGEELLPTPTDENGEFLFRGWYLEADYTTPVDAAYAPETDVTLHAKWAKKITIKVYQDGPEDESPETVDVAEGDKILETLSKYETEKEGFTFRGWYVLAEEEEIFVSPEDTFDSTITDDTGFYAKWDDNTPYIGTFKGSEIYNAGYGSSAVNITIDEEGNITGSKTGTVKSYDRATQVITFTDDSGSDNYFFYDAESGVLVYNYDNSKRQYLGNDMYVLSKYAQTNTISVKFGVQAQSKHDASRNYYAQFVQIQTKGGEKNVFIYDTFIYSNVTITDAFGNPLEISAIKNSKTVVVKDKSGEQLLGVASQGESFGAKSDTVDLDKYFGSYTGDEGDLKLDGAGNAILGNNNGTYTVAPEGSEYTLDLYVTEDGVEVYYELTLDGTAYTLNKAMVNVAYATDSKDTTVEGQGGQVNKNVQITLPTPADAADEYLFRGWYTDAAFEEINKVPTDEEGNYVYKPTADVTFHAKWVKKVTITVHLDGDATLPEGALGANGTIDTYGQDEEVTIVRPSKEGSKFGGWYTDATCQTPWGEMAPDGSTTVKLGTDKTAIDLYPKWEEAPVYSGEYHVYFFEGTNANGSSMNGKLQTGTYKIDAEGFAPAPSGVAWPLNMDATVDFNSEDDAQNSVRALTLTRTNGTNEAFIDLTTKIIVINLRGTGFESVVVLVPLDKDVTEADSYWNEGKQRAITFSGDENVNIFINNGTIHYGVTFEGKDSVAVEADKAYQAERFYVKKDGALVEGIKGFGYNGTTMKELDGKEGDYTYAGEAGGELDFGKLTVNGVGGVTTENKGAGTYTLVSGKSYTAELRLEGLFYYLTLTLNPENYTYTVEKPMVTVTFKLIDGTDDQKNGQELTSSNSFPESGQYNLNTEFTLENVPEVDGYVFRGWYTAKGNWYSSEELNKDGDGNYVYTPTGAVTLYAKFVQKITITIHYGEGMGGDVVIDLAKGESVDDIRDTWPGEPGITNGQRFVGWYKDASFQTEWNDDYPVNESIDIYVKWEAIPEVDYVTSGSNKWTYDDASATWKSATPTSYPYESKLTITFAYSGTYSFDWTLDCDTDAGLTIKWKHADGNSDTTVLNEKGSGSSSSPKNGSISQEVMAGDSFVLTYKKESYAWDIGEDCAKISNIVWTKDILDGNEGTYTGKKTDETVQEQDLILNGKGGVEWAGRTGEYTVKESPDTIEVTLESSGDKPAEYWEITLNKGESTYTAEKPMVTITFETDNPAVTQEPIDYNKNIPVKLPELRSEEGVYTGWFTDASCTEDYAVELDDQGMYTPTEPTTLYTKISTNEVTLTIDYGDHGPQENVTVKLAKGETPDLTEYVPEKDGNFIFDGWYEDAECTTTPYTPAPLDADNTIYAKWKEEEAKPYTIELTNKEGSEMWVLQGDGSYRIDAGKGAKAYIKITFSTSGTFKFDYECQYTDSDGWGDSLFVTVNVEPNSAYYSDKKFSATHGSGTTDAISVQEGDTLYIASMIYVSSYATSGDFGHVFNFTFTATL